MASKVFTAIVSGFRKLKEPNCWSISFHTQEIPKETAMELSDFLDQIVKVVISDSNISYEVIEQVEAVDIKEKEKWTPSQKLRFAIRELQGRQGFQDQDHNEYYRKWIIKFINHINKIE